MVLIIAIIFYVVLPCYLSWLLSKNKEKSLWVWLVQLLFVLSYILAINFTVAWVFVFSIYLRYFVLVFFIFSAWKSYLNNKKRSASFSLLNYRYYLLMVAQGIIICIFLFQVISSVIGSKKPSFSIELDFPLKKGLFYIVHGGNSIFINHHYSVSAQKYALDIVQINFLGFRSEKIFPKQLNEYKIYNTTVYSPCDGIVEFVSDSWNDQVPGVMDHTNPAGNFIAIKKANSDVIVILAHLLSKSTMIRKGEKISTGQAIARVGNSGNTSEPHLHIHCVLANSGDLLFQAKGVPMIFLNRFLTRNELVFSP